jgi:hypothetical protein
VLKKISLTLTVLVVAVLGVSDQLSTADPSKVDGPIYVVPGDFLIDLDSGHLTYAGVALILSPGGTTPPTGPAGDRQAARVRRVITDVLKGQPARRLTRPASLVRLKRRIRRELTARTGLRVRKVVFTDLAVK